MSKCSPTSKRARTGVFGEALEPRNLLTTAGFSLQIVDDSGAEISSIAPGQTVHVEVYAADLRAPGEDRGLATAFVDLNWTNANLVSTPGDRNFDDSSYDDFTDEGDLSPGKIDNAGGVHFALGEPTLGLGEKLLFSVPFTTSADGQVVFSVDWAYGDTLPADIDFVHDTNLAEPAEEVGYQRNPDGTLARDGNGNVIPDLTQFTLDSATLDIGQTGGGEVTADAGGPYNVNEEGSVQLSGSAVSSDSAPITSYEWDLDGDGNYGETGAAAQRGNEVGQTVTFSAAGLDGFVGSTFGVSLIATNSNGVESPADDAMININNVGPGTSSVTGDSIGVSGMPMAYDFSASDVSAADEAAGFTYEIDWGDGSPIEQIATGAGEQLASGTHFFNPPSFAQAKANPFVTVDYDVMVTPIDKDGSRGASATLNVSIAHMRMMGNDLYIGGTSDRDGLYVWNEGEGQNPGGNDATVQIGSEGFPFIPGTDPPRLDIIRTVVPNPAGQFVLWAGPGNDVMGQFTNFATDVQDGGRIPHFDNPRTTLTHPTVQHGGPGSDLLTGGTANDVLYGDEPADGVQPNDPGRIDRIFGLDGDDKIFGGMGDDRIRGHSGNDYLAGEDGSDRILGDNGLDIMDGGDGRDAINGLRNNDIVIGGPGDDFISDIRGGFSLFIGGTGFDRLDSSRTGGNAIFIPGTTAYDIIDPDNPFDSALVDLLNEWSTVNSGNINQIVNNLTTGDGGRLQPLNSGSVFDDSSTDWLIGDLDANNPLGPDLFFEVNQPDDVVNPDASLNELGPLPNDVVVNP